MISRVRSVNKAHHSVSVGDSATTRRSTTTAARAFERERRESVVGVKRSRGIVLVGRIESRGRRRTEARSCKKNLPNQTFLLYTTETRATIVADGNSSARLASSLTSLSRSFARKPMSLTPPCRRRRRLHLYCLSYFLNIRIHSRGQTVI